MLNGLYADVARVNLVTDPDVTATGKVAQISADVFNGFRIRRVFGGSKAAAGFSLRLWMANLPPDNLCIPSFTLLSGASVQQCTLTVDTTGKIIIHTGNGAGAQIGATTVPVLTANAWNHIEFKSTANVTTGAFEVRVNGASVLTGSGNTGTEYSQFCVEVPNSTGSSLIYYLKDLVAWDTHGSFNNNFLGPCSVLDLLPTSDVSLTWTPSSGTTGFNRINIIPPTDDASYISAASVLTSTFNFADLPANVSSVKALIVDTRPRKTDGGDGSVQAGLKSGATTGSGADRPITTAYTYYEDVFETDPATGAAWTPTAVNAAQLSLKRTV
jgi:hypothetical protein